jgi:alpha-1,3-mannosyl-glycoprotein beta-1,2-N-acetylglucosaminyltransferase
MRSRKIKRGNTNNKGNTNPKVYFLLFAAGFVAVAFFLIGGILKSCSGGITPLEIRRIVDAVGVKDIKDVSKTFQDLEAKYEASLQTIKSLQLQMERSKASLQIGSVNSAAIPGIKPLQDGEEYQQAANAGMPKLTKRNENTNQLMPPPGEGERLPIKSEVNNKPGVKKTNLRHDPEVPRKLVKSGNSNNVIVGKTALVVICFNRADYLRKTLDKIFEYYRQENEVTIFISQDGRVSSVISVIDNFIEKFKLKFPASKVPIHLYHSQSNGGNGYEKLAKHFKFALNEIFVKRNHARTIIVEDDLEIAPDFFEYFNSMAPILDNDDTVMAVSAWNDNGFGQFISDPARVVRSDFFPGLGWMLNRNQWDEWGQKWPGGYWDDWLREPPQRKNRVTLRPEISRTYTFGRRGVSNAQFFGKYLAKIVLNKEKVDWKHQDLSYLKKNVYDKQLMDAVDKATVTSPSEISRISHGNGKLNHDVKIFYNSLHKGVQPSFNTIATQLGIMGDAKARVPRTAYLGIVTLKGGHGSSYRIFLVPSQNVELK